MAARAKIRFSTSGADRVTGAFGKIGSSAGKAGTGIGAAFAKIMYTVGKVSMLAAGLQNMGKSALGAERDVGKFRDGTVTALSAVSKKVAETRRKYYFLKFAGEKIAEPFIWAMGAGGKAKTKGKEKVVEEPKEKPVRWLDSLGLGVSKTADKAEATTTKWQKFFNLFTTGSGRIALLTKALSVLKFTLISVGIALGVAATAGGVAFVVLGFKAAKYAKRMVVDFMNIREAFRQYEISLGGIIRNTYSLGKMMQFATKYASEYPAMFEEVLDTFRSLAALPALKPMFRRADEQDLKGIMDVIQGLATLDPIQGVKGAGIALREALSGDMRSVRRRFEIPPKAVAEAGGYTLNEITQDSEKALKAFRAFIELNVPAKSMADAAMTIGIQFGNLRDKYRSFINEVMKSTGAYWSVVTALSSINNWLQKAFASPVIKQWAMTMGDHIRAFVKTLESTLSKVDWEKYIKEGRLVEGFMDAAQRVSSFMEAMAEMWGKPFVAVVSKIAGILWKGLRPVFWELIKSIWGLFKEGFLTAGKLAATSLLEGLASGNIFKSIGSLFVSLAKFAASVFISAFVGGFNLLGPLLTKQSKVFKDFADYLEKNVPGSKGGIWRPLSEELKAGGEYLTTGGPKLVKALSDSMKKEAGNSDIGKTLEEQAEQSRKDYLNAIKNREAEVVTPEIPIKEHEWLLESLKKQLAASKKFNESQVIQKSIMDAIAKRTKELDRAKRLKLWNEEEGQIAHGINVEIGKIETSLIKAKNEGKNLSASVYESLKALKIEGKKYELKYNIVVEGQTEFDNLYSAIRSSKEELGKWREEFITSQKAGGELLVVLKKMQDIVGLKSPVEKDVWEDLWKKRIELTQKAIEAAKKYKEEILSVSKDISEKFASTISGVGSLITSFADKLKGAFLGIPKYEGDWPEPKKDVRYKNDKERDAARSKAFREGLAKLKTEGREKDFGRKVMDRIKDIVQIPANLFGLGRSAMTYKEGMEADRPGLWTSQHRGSEIPGYIRFMLNGIHEAMASRMQGGPAEFAGGRKVLSEMRMGLLEKAIPFTKWGSNDRADIYARMAGAQMDLMQSTLQVAQEESRIRAAQLAELQQNSADNKAALDVSKTMSNTLRDIAINTSKISGASGGDALSSSYREENVSTDEFAAYSY